MADKIITISDFDLVFRGNDKVRFATLDLPKNGTVISGDSHPDLLKIFVEHEQNGQQKESRSFCLVEHGSPLPNKKTKKHLKTFYNPFRKKTYHLYELQN